jgi:hypothetical protein
MIISRHLLSFWIAICTSSYMNYVVVGNIQLNITFPNPFCVRTENDLRAQIQAASTTMDYTRIDVCVNSIDLTQPVINVTNKSFDLRCQLTPGRRCQLNGQNQNAFFFGNNARIKVTGMTFQDGNDFYQRSRPYPSIYLTESSITLTDSNFHGNAGFFSVFSMASYNQASKSILNLRNVGFQYMNGVRNVDF